MTEEQLEQFQKSMEEAVKNQIYVTVNGGIVRLTEKVDRLNDIMVRHMADDRAVAEASTKRFDDYVKSDNEWKDRAKPVIKLGENVSWSTIAILKILGVIATICGIAAALYSFTKR